MTELSYAFGWTLDEVLSLTLPQCQMFMRELGAIKQDEHLMLLAIVTNPHIDPKKQGDLWKRLQRPRAKPPQSIDYEAERKKLEEHIRRKRV